MKLASMDAQENPSMNATGKSIYRIDDSETCFFLRQSFNTLSYFDNSVLFVLKWHRLVVPDYPFSQLCIISLQTLVL